jgi:hypothetical protein
MANVVGLPTAAPNRVQQQCRRGRLPKTIGSLSEARYRRHQRTEEKSEQEYQCGLDAARAEHKATRDRLERLCTQLLEAATSGDLRSLVFAADVRGEPLALVMAGNADKSEALSMACRLQRRIASSLDHEDQDGDE